MTIVCQNCSTRLQIDDDKAPAGAFSVRCPKCKTTVNSAAASPASDQSALAVGGSPSTEHPRYDQVTAPVYQFGEVAKTPDNPINEDALRSLLSLFGQNGSPAGVRNWVPLVRR